MIGGRACPVPHLGGFCCFITPRDGSMHLRVDHSCFKRLLSETCMELKQEKVVVKFSGDWSKI